MRDALSSSGLCASLAPHTTPRHAELASRMPSRIPEAVFDVARTSCGQAHGDSLACRQIVIRPDILSQASDQSVWETLLARWKRVAWILQNIGVRECISLELMRHSPVVKFSWHVS